MRKTYIFLILVLLAGCTPSKSGKQQTDYNLILISFDGFRADYLERTDTPNLDKLISNGVTSPGGMIPSYPSVTFTNHYTIATGLYPKNHGIINNNMYDAEIGARYSIGNREQVENPAWYRGEPIWNTVEKNGKKAGTMFWVGSETKIQDMRPSHWKVYDGSMPDSARIDSVISWMTAGAGRAIDFATLYFDVIDTQGHRHGPDSQEVTDAVKHADNLVGYLLEKLEEHNLRPQTNLIIVSDHGMSEVSRERIIVLDDYINPDEVEFIAGSPAVMLNAAPGRLDAVYESLKNGENHYEVYKKEDIPERYNLSGSDRMPQLLVVVDPGYTLNVKSYFDRRPDYPSGGAHGYNHLDKEMRALFIAEGPSFKKGYKIDSFQNIHLYELMTGILNIEPAENDGNLVDIAEILN